MKFDKLYKLLSEEHDQIKGGLADGKTIQSIAKKHGVPVTNIMSELRSGITVEMEHTDDRDKAREIALDHLTEYPDYYSRLKKMEDKADAENK